LLEVRSLTRAAEILDFDNQPTVSKMLAAAALRISTIRFSCASG